jgi:hypothetical protein
MTLYCHYALIKQEHPDKDQVPLSHICLQPPGIPVSVTIPHLLCSSWSLCSDHYFAVPSQFAPLSAQVPFPREASLTVCPIPSGPLGRFVFLLRTGGCLTSCLVVYPSPNPQEEISPFRQGLLSALCAQCWRTIHLLSERVRIIPQTCQLGKGVFSPLDEGGGSQINNLRVCLSPPGPC